jgi:hypothetical protein
MAIAGIVGSGGNPCNNTGMYVAGWSDSITHLETSPFVQKLVLSIAYDVSLQKASRLCNQADFDQPPANGKRILLGTAILLIGNRQCGHPGSGFQILLAFIVFPSTTPG